MIFSVALFTLLCSQAWAYLPPLNIDPKGISCSGISSGADFAVQFQVAFSVVSGVGVYAGEPFHCGVTRFANDELQKCSQQPASQLGPGCTPGSAPCDGCPANTTIIYDHCKNHPEWVDVDALVNYTMAQSALGNIDDAQHLSSARVYLYRGTLDTCYLEGSVAKTEAYYAKLVSSADQIVFEKTIPSLHAMPTLTYGSPCGTSSPRFPPAMEACGYDGAGAALQHIYNNKLKPRASSFDMSDIFQFDQTRYFPYPWTGLADSGYAYVPPHCTDLSAQCRLHVVFHGCGMSTQSPSMNISYVVHAGYNEWGASNNIVVLYPQSGGYAQHRRTGTTQQNAGCWDSYGQQVDAAGTAINYATKLGAQMQSVRTMVKALTGL